MTNPGFSSSRSSCRRQGSSSLSLHGLRVLAASAEAERHHSEVHSVLLPPLPHRKWRITSRFPSISQDLAADALPSPPSHSAFLVVFLVMLSPHAEQSPHLHLTPEDSCFITRGCGRSPRAIVYLAASQALPAAYQTLECIGHNCALIDSQWTAAIDCTARLHIKCRPSLLPSPPHDPAHLPSLLIPHLESTTGLPLLCKTVGTCALHSSSSRLSEDTEVPIHTI